MSEIVKTEAIVLSKINYGDTSKIVSLFTKEYGKISAIIKGGRSSKSKIGLIVDPINYLQVVLYKKDSREVQLISNADLISHFPKIKEDFEKLKYSSAILELVKKLTPDHEQNEKLFRGILRILNLINASEQETVDLFGRFFVFFLTELGYDLQLSECTKCGRTNLRSPDLAYNYDLGILCGDCRNTYMETYPVDMELFYYLNCLKNNDLIEHVKEKTKMKAINFLEKYLLYHVPDFSGIQSFKLFN